MQLIDWGGQTLIEESFSIVYSKLSDSNISDQERSSIENQKILLNSIVLQLSEKFDLGNFTKLIIPIDYRNEVLACQESLGYLPYSTLNDYSEAYGQMLRDIRDSNNIKYIIYIKSEIANFIFPESFIDSIVESQKLERKSLEFLRSFSLKLLLHEIIHIHEAEVIRKNNIKLIYKPENNIYDQFIAFSYILWQEYYATRIPAEIIRNYQDDIHEIHDRWTNIENEIVKNRFMYNCETLDFDSFCRKNALLFRTILIELVYYVANLYSLNENEFASKIEIDIALLSNLKINRIIRCFLDEMNKLYISFPDWESDEVFRNIMTFVLEYEECFEIIYSDTELGVKMDVKFSEYLYKQYNIGDPC